MLIRLLCIVCGVFGSLLIHAEDHFLDGRPSGILVTGTDPVLSLVKPSGEALLTLTVGGKITDIQVLKNGNILFSNGEVAQEITPEGKSIWCYKPTYSEGGGPYSAQRMPDGTTVIAENSTGTVLDVDSVGVITDSFTVINFKRGDHCNTRLARKLQTGNYLVCHMNEKTVREYTRDGKVVWEQKTKGRPFQAERLSNGNTMISSLDQITEFALDGSIVWEFKKTDISGVVIRNMAGFEMLSNGNLLIGCYTAYTKSGEGNSMFEITRDKKLVWRWAKPKGHHTTLAVRQYRTEPPKK